MHTYHPNFSRTLLADIYFLRPARVRAAGRTHLELRMGAAERSGRALEPRDVNANKHAGTGKIARWSKKISGESSR